MRISPVGFQRMRELKKCHKQDIFLTERKIPFARDPSLREKVIAFHTLFRELTREKVVSLRKTQRSPSALRSVFLCAGSRNSYSARTFTFPQKPRERQIEAQKA